MNHIKKSGLGPEWRKYGRKKGFYGEAEGRLE